MTAARRSSILRVEDSNQFLVTGNVEPLEEDKFSSPGQYRLSTSEGETFTLVASGDVHDMETMRGRKVCVLSTLRTEDNEITLEVLGFRIITPEAFDLDTGLIRKR